MTGTFDHRAYRPGQWGVLGLAFFLLVLAGLNGLFAWQIGGWLPSVFAFVMIFISSLLLWLFVALDWPSLLCIVGLGLIPEIGFNQVLKWSFGNVTFVFLLFTFVVTYSLSQTPVLQRLTGWAMGLAWAQANAWRFLVMFLTLFLILGLFLSPTVLFMFAFPLYEEVCHRFSFQKGDRVAAYFLIALFMTIAIGTAMTPINHVFAITAISLFRESTHQTLTYGQYMAFAVPTGLMIFLILLGSLAFLIKKEMTRMTAHRLTSLDHLPRMTVRHKVITFLFFLMIGLWLFPDVTFGAFPAVTAVIKSWGLAFPPLLITIIMTVVPIEGRSLLNLGEAMQKGIHWPSLFLVAATMSVGAGMSLPELGLMQALSQQVAGILIPFPALGIVALIILWAGLQTNFSSNLVTVTMVTGLTLTLMPLMTQVGVHVAVLVCLIGFMASLAWMTPPAMPYVAIAIGSRWTSAGRVMTFGLWMLVWTIVTVILIGYPLGTLWI